MALIIRGMRIDLELSAERVSVAVVALSVDAKIASVLIETFPGDDKVTAGIHRHGGMSLVIGGVGVDAEFVPYRTAIAIVSLSIDTKVTAVLEFTHPSDDKVAVGIHRGGGIALASSAGGIDLEFIARGSAIAVVSLSKDAQVVLVGTHPGDDKVTVVAHRH